MKTGYISQIDSFATLEGEGIRYALFLQGCPMSCVYCHNVDTQKFTRNSKIIMTSQEVFDKVMRYRAFYRNGGVTFTGGEPLSQAEFVLETAKLLKGQGINICVDTSATIINEFVDELITYIDTAIVDIKFASNEDYKKYARVDTDKLLDRVIAFATNCLQRGVEVILRTVVVPGINNSKEKLDEYIKVVKKIGLNKLELLPFHTLGFSKYESIEIENPLKGTHALDIDELNELQDYVDKRLN